MQSKFKIIIAMIIWGSIGVFVKNVDLPSMEIAFLRAVIAVGVLAIAGIWIKSDNRWDLIKSNLFYLILSGIALGLNWVLLFQAFKYTTISNATLSYYFAPVFVILLSPFVLREKFTITKFFSVIGSMIGLLLTLYSQTSLQNVSLNNSRGVAFGLMAAILYASVIIFNKQIKDIPSYERTLVQILISALILLPFIIYRNSIHISGFSALPLILILGVVHTGLAYLLYFSGVKDLPAQNVAVLSYIDPISAIIFGTTILREPLTLWQVIGGLLILGSTYLGEKHQ